MSDKTKSWRERDRKRKQDRNAKRISPMRSNSGKQIEPPCAEYDERDWRNWNKEDY